MRWSADDRAFLREHYPSRGAAFVAARVSRSSDAVKREARQLGVRVNPKRLAEVMRIARAAYDATDRTEAHRAAGRHMARLIRERYPEQMREWQARGARSPKRDIEAMRRRMAENVAKVGPEKMLEARLRGAKKLNARAREFALAREAQKRVKRRVLGSSAGNREPFSMHELLEFREVLATGNGRAGRKA